MPHQFQNDVLDVIVDLPNENYQFSRFDWSGKISSVKFRGIPCTTSETIQNIDITTQGRGLYNEFDLQGPSDFMETEIGNYFNKIGIGELTKNDAPYDFFHPYSINPSHFEYQCLPDGIRIISTPNAPNPIYKLIKHIYLRQHQLIIDYELMNTSSKPLQTVEYTHNFLSIDEDPIGQHYVLKFPFNIDPVLLNQTVNSEQIVQFNGQQILFKSIPQEAFYFSNLGGNKTVKAQWTLVHAPSNITITETTSFKSKLINLWGTGHVVSPELFYHIDVKAGQTCQWTRVYSFTQ